MTIAPFTRITYHLPLRPKRDAIIELPPDLTLAEVRRLQAMLEPLAMDFAEEDEDAAFLAEAEILNRHPSRDEEEAS
jgi:hypothetical protein